MTPQDYLDENDLSLEDLAARVNQAADVKTSQPSLTRYFRGERRIPADLALRIERVTDLQVTVEDLVRLRKQKRAACRRKARRPQ